MADDTSLIYKNQDPFFIDYYEFRNQAIEAKALIINGEKLKIIVALNKLLDFTVDYVHNYENKIEELEELLKNYKTMNLKDFRRKINSFWKNLSADHVKYDILPKPKTNENEDLSSLDDKTRAALEAFKILRNLK